MSLLEGQIATEDIAQAIALLKAEKSKRAERELYEGSLIDFVEAGWSSLDTAEYRPSWAIGALCDHLQAVSEGHIKRLLVNFPPRAGKTNITSIMFPAWTWARSEKSYLSGDSVKFLCASYNDKLSWDNSTKNMRLLGSPWYQSLWGNRFKLQLDQHSKYHFDLTTGGGRISVTTRAAPIGQGGDIIIVDDPHNTETAESAAERFNVTRWWREVRSTRLNDPKQTAIIVIMQRLHEEDVSGVILGEPDAEEWTHLMIPMEYEWPRHCHTVLGWDDPRGLDANGECLLEWDAPLQCWAPRDDIARITLGQRQGELMWPERFGHKEIESMKIGLGPYMASGRLQQAPVPSKGTIFEREWWELWEHPGGKFPRCELVVCSVDGAFTEREENNPSGMTVWGKFQWCKTCRKAVDDWQDKEHSDPHVCQCGPRRVQVGRIILLDAWREFLALSGVPMPREQNETLEHYVWRTKPHWGLVEMIAWTANRKNADVVLIEAKGPGISAAQMLRNYLQDQKWGVQLCPAKGDKVARALAAQPSFAQGLVFAPAKDWAQLVVDEMAMFPKGKYDDLCLAAGTQIYTRRGAVAIEQVTTADVVITPYGWKRVLATHCMGFKPVMVVDNLVGTANHAVFTLDHGLVRMDSISQACRLARFTLCDLIQTIRQTKFNSMVFGTAGWVGHGAIIYRKPSRERVQRVCTLQSGNITLGSQFLQGMKFITETATLSIAALTILSAYRLASTAAWLNRTSIGKSAKNFFNKFARLLLPGIDQRKDELGIANMPSSQFNDQDFNESQWQSWPSVDAPSAENSSKPNAIGGCIAQPIAKEKSPTSGRKNADCLVAAHHAALQAGMFARFPYVQVYDLTIEDAHCYYANGILVHNTDSACQAINFLRQTGNTSTDGEIETEHRRRITYYKPKQKAIYPV